MNNSRKNCRIFKQILILGTLLGSGIAMGGEAGMGLEVLNPYAVIMGRNPSSFIPDEGLESLPSRQKGWTENLLVEDSAGVMNSIRWNIGNWENIEEYNRQWNLESTGLHKAPGREFKKRYLSKRLLKYADKRLSGEIKNAEEGSAMKKVQRVHTTLRPNTRARISENVKLRFKARVLQGKAMIVVENPYVDYKTSIKLNGRVEMNLRKSIKSLGLRTAVDYKIDQKTWLARIDRPLSKSLTARVSSLQSDSQLAFGKNSVRRAELLFRKGF